MPLAVDALPLTDVRNRLSELVAEIRQAEAEASRGEFTSAEAMPRLREGRRRGGRGGA